MVVGNIVKEETTLPTQEVSVDCGGSSTLEVPFLSTIMRHDWVSVMKVGDHNDYSMDVNVTQG
jgi:hypothetical protein